MSYIEKGKKSANLICGGHQLDRAGYFIEPTIFADCTADMEIVNNEIFGPVLSVLKFDELEEAVSLANNSSYGLVSAVFTTD